MITAHLINMLSGVDNKSVDVGRVLMCALVGSFIILETVSVVFHGVVFDMMAFAGSSAALLAGGAGAIRLKASTEPSGEKQ